MEIDQLESVTIEALKKAYDNHQTLGERGKQVRGEKMFLVNKLLRQTGKLKR